MFQRRRAQRRSSAGHHDDRLSLLTKRCEKNIGMTGEVTPRGRVLEIGGPKRSLPPTPPDSKKLHPWENNFKDLENLLLRLKRSHLSTQSRRSQSSNSPLFNFCYIRVNYFLGGTLWLSHSQRKQRSLACILSFPHFRGQFCSSSSCQYAIPTHVVLVLIPSPTGGRCVIVPDHLIGTAVIPCELLRMEAKRHLAQAMDVDLFCCQFLAIWGLLVFAQNSDLLVSSL